ncbi:SURF1 family protein [Teredinibacter sp. KSP-S5-2]|uniref:SURF1 family protein n=1 Tax=Teredinibacter sp. KSP-S5-2 TaxID=3034506 RepID=UPI0029343BFC|nr:SURF1 family protein [Teredinibacter sp. KSP-S5-2]WNO09192.1 SURF1 family protein [Teredinibacter sp. KSP-S5-2]
MTSKQTFQFVFNWKITVFAICMLPILIRLGFWQLSRAEEKETLLEVWAEQQALPAIEWRLGMDEQNKYRRIRTTGEFDASRYWLIEGKHLNGKLGFDVVMPFRIKDSDNWILVNRGWLPAGQYREQLPEFTTPSGILSISGQWSIPSDLTLVDEVTDLTQTWPKKVLEVDTELMSKQLHSNLENRILLVDEDNASALAVNWITVNTSPAKHYGYAVQWFAMAVALCILWLFANSNISSLLGRRK